MRWLKNLRARRRRYDDLAVSIREHIEDKAEDLMEEGLSRDEALRQARLEFGHVDGIEERSREVWQWPWLEGTLRDLGYALRRMCRSPGFTAAVVLTLGLGIGASVAVFSLVDAVLLRPLQFGHEQRLVQVFEERPALGLVHDTPAPANYYDWKRSNHVFADMAAAVGNIFAITGNGHPEEVDGARISANLLPVLGVRPLLGRNFTAAEDQPGTAVALIGAGIWRARYGSDPDVINRSIELSGEAYRIVGVMPAGFDFPQDSAVWVPLALSDADRAERDSHYLLVYGLLRPGVTVESARRDMADISRQLERDYPATNHGLGTSVIPLREELLGASGRAIAVLAAGVALFLILTCANVAGLIVARAAAGRREAAIRVALGAGRMALLRQGLAEGGVLALGGCVLGVLLAWAAMPLMWRLVPESMAAWAKPQVNGAALCLAALIGLVTVLVFGFAGRRTAAARPWDALIQGGLGCTDSRQTLRSSLVTGEIALTTVVLTAAGLLAGAGWKLARTEVGFDPGPVLTMRTQLPISARTPYGAFAVRASYYRRILARVEQLPGVRTAGYATFLPFTNSGGSTTILIQGAPPLPVGQVNDVNLRVVTPEYFRAMGIPLLRGRFFDDADGEIKAPLAVINQKMARAYWPDGDAVRRQFRFDDPGTPWMTVIGIVGDVRQTDQETPSRAEMYFSYAQDLGIPTYFAPRDLAVSVAGEPMGYADAVEKAIWSVDPEQPVTDIQPMRRIVEGRMATSVLEAELFTFFAFAGLLISALGLYGLVSYSAARRTQEIGIRMALGAERRRVLGSFLALALRLLLAGLGLGAVGAAAAARLLASTVYGISGPDWGFVAVALMALAGAAALAAYIPARRAARLDPMRALRAE